ncbi:tetratricopeptide repeat protein [Ekhidna sp.]
MKKQAIIFISVIYSILFANLGIAQNSLFDDAGEYLMQEKNDKALQLLSDSAANYESNPGYFELLGKAHYNLESFDQAIEAFIKCIELDNSNADCHYLLGSVLLDKLQITESLFQKGSIASKAKASLLRSIELQPSHIEAREKLANYYLNAPLIAGGSNTKAQEQATEIMKYNEIKGRTLMATIHVNRQAYDEAEREYIAILKKDSSNTNTMYNLGNFYVDRKRYDEAFEIASNMIESFPDVLLGYYFYGRLASITKNNVAKGKKCMMKFIDESPEKSTPAKHWAYYRLALLKKKMGEDYKQDAAKALELYPDFKQAKALLNE